MARRYHKTQGKRVLGVDPGSQVTGFGVVEDSGSGLECLCSGTIRTTKARKKEGDRTDLGERLVQIYDGLASIIEKYLPQAMAVESLFHAKNAQSALKLGHARGVILFTAAQFGLELYEYTPRAIKKGVTGSGGATKDQVQKMVERLLSGSISKSLDATDALAVAIHYCHCQPWLRRKQLREYNRIS